MTTGLKTKASGNADLDAVFDPYVQGTSPPATGLNVGGTTTDINTRYAPIVFGSAAAATGWNTKQSGHADLNTLFAAFGTAVYSLPIDGHGYSSSGAGPGGSSVRAEMNFQINTSGWTLVATGTGKSPTTLASGAMPSTASTIVITDTWLNATGDTTPGIVVNTCSSSTTIPATGTVGNSITITGTTSGQTTHSVHIVMKNSSGTTISTTTFTAECDTSNG